MHWKWIFFFILMSFSLPPGLWASFLLGSFLLKGIIPFEISFICFDERTSSCILFFFACKWRTNLFFKNKNKKNRLVGIFWFMQIAFVGALSGMSPVQRTLLGVGRVSWLFVKWHYLMSNIWLEMVIKQSSGMTLGYGKVVWRIAMVTDIWSRDGG